jgi:hypothetical protein
VPAAAMNAYNALRVLGRQATAEAGRKKFKRKWLGKMIVDIICVAGKLARHAGQLVLKVYEGGSITPVFVRLNAALDSL